jgi:hypothetical protein
MSLSNLIKFKLLSPRQAAAILALCLSLLGLLACETRKIALPAVEGRTLYGVDTNNNLIRFGSQDPQTIANTNAINLPNGEQILGIDFRPADGRLYGLGSYSRLYVIDTLYGAALQVGISLCSKHEWFGFRI